MTKTLRCIGCSLLNWRFWIAAVLFLTIYALLIRVFGTRARIIELPILYFIAHNYGRWTAVIAAIFMVPLNLSLFYGLGGQEILAMIDARYWIVSVALVLIFYEIGYSHELRRNLSEELQRSKELSTELAAERDRVQCGSEAKDKLLMSISHDLRTPLSAMIQSAQLIEAEPLHAEKHALLIKRTGHQLLKVVNDLLRGYRQQEDASPTLLAEPLDLHRLLDEIIELNRALYSIKNLQLTLERDATVPVWILGHVQQLRQILINLLSNSLKYTTNGGATLKAQILNGDNGEQLQLLVGDTGCGITEEKIAPLINAAREKARLRMNGGEFSYGIGLSNCLRMTEAIGASLQLLPNRPRGTLAILQLPLLRSKPPVHLTNRNRQYIPLNTPCPTIVVDDDYASAESLTELLAYLGCDTLSVTNGHKAKEAAKFHDFKLGFIDLQLPDTNGGRLISDLRHSMADTTLVLFSANILLNDLDQWLNPNIDLILSKPIELHELAELCHHAEAGRQFTQPLKTSTPVPVAERHRVLMFDYLRQALAAYERQDYSACAYELHRLASASGTLHLHSLNELTVEAEQAASGASRVSLFITLRNLALVTALVLGDPTS